MKEYTLIKYVVPDGLIGNQMFLIKSSQFEKAGGRLTAETRVAQNVKLDPPLTSDMTLFVPLALRLQETCPRTI